MVTKHAAFLAYACNQQKQQQQSSTEQLEQQANINQLMVVQVCSPGKLEYVGISTAFSACGLLPSQHADLVQVFFAIRPQGVR